MSGASLTITQNELDGALERAVAAGANPRQLMDAVGGYMLTAVQRRFETETGPDGQPWKPLSPRTANARVNRSRRRGYENKLRVTGKLYASLTQQADETSAQVGTNDVRAGVHQFGHTFTRHARSQRAKMARRNGRLRFVKKAAKRARDINITIGEHQVSVPARPFLGFADADLLAIREIGEDHLRDVIIGGGNGGAVGAGGRP
ncbi:MAG: phage virion morphogenesis protein [Pseudomonadota bacterium]